MVGHETASRTIKRDQVGFALREGLFIARLAQCLESQITPLEHLAIGGMGFSHVAEGREGLIAMARFEVVGC